MLRSWLLLAVCLGASPAHAAEIEENEPLVMRLIFEDCLGYIRHGRTPFEGLATRPASREAIDQLPSRVPNREQAIELLSPRYVASWGRDADGGHCLIFTVWSAVRDGLPMRLGVRAKDFLGRVTERARAAGLDEAFPADTFSPLATSLWSEKSTGHDAAPLRPVSFTILPTGGDEASGLMDAGLIVVGGPPQGRP
ncbi:MULTISPECIES: hypothetical protein [Methylorubrum]|uniref:hypothetical protein n=1 Tax=Methylorubrum TaxID=2282523 RepID=UPI0020A22C32|nr:MULTISPECIES: hypothetical protein [Methylorubrum]MCP1548225.1 hypothetical protein [Methylorubrum zatmanii]MCP1555160.1 hypothetical protein [Methylorubrum extorquens]MCP1578528.1 hypothetical protein [Methylorubrum extorquens]